MIAIAMEKNKRIVNCCKFYDFNLRIGIVYFATVFARAHFFNVSVKRKSKKERNYQNGHCICNAFYFILVILNVHDNLLFLLMLFSLNSSDMQEYFKFRTKFMDHWRLKIRKSRINTHRQFFALC